MIRDNVTGSILFMGRMSSPDGEVKPAAAPDSAFVTLAPRQLITRVPMAGYADAAAFTRAFRRWRGVAPSEWRTRRAAGAKRRRPA